MCESVSKVISVNVEIMGRRLSFTYDEAMALMGVLRDAFGEPCDRRYVAPPVKEWWSGPDDNTTGTRPSPTSPTSTTSTTSTT